MPIVNRIAEIAAALSCGVGADKVNPDLPVEAAPENFARPVGRGQPLEAI